MATETLSPEAQEQKLVLDRRDAAETMAAHPEHYRCRSYPDQPTLAEARPTGNVLVIIQYVNGAYKVTHGDGRVHVAKDDAMYPPDATHPTAYQRTNFVWTYRKDVAQFGVFFQNWADGAPDHWSTPKSVRHRNQVLSLEPRTGADTPVIIIVATDRRSCYPNSHERILPPTMWQELAAVGLLRPQPS